MNFESLTDARLLYMGTPDISAKVLTELLARGVNIVGVVTNPDKVAGRGDKLEYSPVKKVALASGLPLFQPVSIKRDFAFLKEVEFDAILTMAYGQIVPEEVLSHPKYGCYNLHGSLLPKYRGAAPMQRALFDGEKETGVTLMEMVKAMDAGRMYAKRVIPLSEEDNYTSLSEKVAMESVNLVMEELLSVLNKENLGEPQDDSLVTYAAKIEPEEEHLRLDSVDGFLRSVRALSLTPGGYLWLGEKKMKVFSAKRHSDEVVGALGEVISAKKGVFVQAKDGVISLLSVQLEGKKRMDAASFANGVRDLKGMLLR